jgi:chemotaxis protein methyltransferase CheR
MELGSKEISMIGQTLKESTGIDFSNYAFSSFRRRIIRFIELNKIRDLNLFINNIKTNTAFSDVIVREITVNVTEMFRDPSFWIVLRDTVLPMINNGSDFKIWHAACSTGEEVYSMAILLKEAGMLKRARIMATDLNRNVLDAAQKGIYSQKSQEINSRNYEHAGGNDKLSGYYSVHNGMVQYNRDLVDRVDFRIHDLTSEGTNSEFDLILCRNVLIYFNFELQERVILSFSTSLSNGSFLAIGSKESLTWCKAARFFETSSAEENIYRKTTEKTQYKRIGF